MSRLALKNIAAGYSDVPVLRDLSLELDQGEVVAVLGKSGCGKSTLLRVINATVPLSAGTILLDNEVIIDNGGPKFEEWEIRRKLALVMQETALFPFYTVEANIGLGLQVRKEFSESEVRRRVRDMALALDLGTSLSVGQILQRFPGQLSGGQRQRVQLARSLILNPSVLLLDEVTSQLDPQTTNEVTKCLRRVRVTSGTHMPSILMVTHLISFAMSFADRIVVIGDGRVIKEGSAKQLCISGEISDAMAVMSESREEEK